MSAQTYFRGQKEDVQRRMFSHPIYVDKNDMLDEKLLNFFLGLQLQFFPRKQELGGWINKLRFKLK